jgi:predicted O-methyltransferase YrrM
MRVSETSEDITYMRRLYATECGLLRVVRQAAEAEGRAGMQVGAEEGALLAWLVEAHGVQTIVEIGSFMGYSALWMAQALPEGGMLHAIERDERIATQTQTFFSQATCSARLTLHVGEAEEMLQALAGQVRPDMVFIDANKSGYPAYLDWAAEHLRPGGLLVADNTLLFGTVAEEEPPKGKRAMWQAMRAFNQRLADDPIWQSIMLPTKEGLTLAMKQK